MKNLLYFLPLLVLLSGCQSNEDRLPGTWELMEVLSDPGDGSGEFQAVNSDEQVTFTENGEFSANVDFCGRQGAMAEDAIGRYLTDERIILIDNCVNEIDMSYEFSGRRLIISQRCFEACQRKYRKRN